MQSQPPRFYYEQLSTFQGMVDSFAGVHGRRPKAIDELYTWSLLSRGSDSNAAIDLADWISYYDIEPNSLLAIVNVNAHREKVAQRLLALANTEVERPSTTESAE